MLNLVLFGPPGAGKGTQAEKMIEKYGLLHISTGDAIRAEVEEGTLLGIQAKSLIDRGELLPDDTVIEIIHDFIQDNNNGVIGTIFDGFPRTITQSMALNSMLSNENSQVDMVISLEVEDQILIDRILNRGKTSGRADDLSEEVVRNRIAVYKKQTSIVKEYYAKQNKVAEINGVGSIDDIFAEICKAIDSVK